MHTTCMRAHARHLRMAFLSVQFCSINDQTCPANAAAWDVCSMPTAMLYRDRERLGSIMDAELCLEREADLPGSRRGFKFMAGLACYHSAHIMRMTQVLSLTPPILRQHMCLWPIKNKKNALIITQTHSEAGSSGRDRLFVIPANITDNPAVLECLQFYLMTSILVDIRSLTQQGTIPMEQALTYQAVRFPEFSFDLLASSPPPRAAPMHPRQC